MAVIPKIDKRAATDAVRKERLVNTLRSSMGSAAPASTRRNKYQKSNDIPNTPITWNDSHGYVLPAHENPTIMLAEAKARHKEPKKSIR